MVNPQLHLCIVVEEVGKVRVGGGGVEDNSTVGDEEVGDVEVEDITEVEEREASITAGTAEAEGDTPTVGGGAGGTVLNTEAWDSARAISRKAGRDGSTPGCWRTPGQSWRTRARTTPVKRTRAGAGRRASGTTRRSRCQSP